MQGARGSFHPTGIRLVLLNGTPSTGSSPVWRRHTTIESPPKHPIVVRGDLDSLLRDLGQRLNLCVHLGVQDLDGVHLTRHCRDYCHTMSQLHVFSETVTPQIGVFESLPGTADTCKTLHNPMKKPHRLGAQRGYRQPILQVLPFQPTLCCKGHSKQTQSCSSLVQSSIVYRQSTSSEVSSTVVALPFPFSIL